MTNVETGTELATIERAMGNRHSEYFAGPRIDGETVMARRYRSLIEADAANAALTSQVETASPLATMEIPPSDPQPEAVEPITQATRYWENPTGRKILNEWSRQGGFEHNYEAARIFVADAFAAMPRATRLELQSQIDGLPDGVQVAMIAELANPYVRVDTATPAHITRFSSTSEGAELVREWGRAAPRRVALATTRIQRLIDRLSPSEAVSFTYFADHVSTAEFKALLDYLSK